MKDVQITEVAGQDALKHWDQLRAQHAVTGIWPVILGGEESLNFLRENDEPIDVAQVLTAASGISPTLLIHSRLEQHFDGFEDEDGNPVDVEGALSEVLGTWPSQPPTLHTPTAHVDLASRRERPLKRVFIGSVKVSHSADVFPFIQEGGWNEYPGAEEHVALHRDWAKRFGSEVLSVTHDIIECVVHSPPKTRDAAMALAQEQFAYAPDIVEQGCESISVLAASLLNAKYWFFWWD